MITVLSPTVCCTEGCDSKFAISYWWSFGTVLVAPRAAERDPVAMARVICEFVEGLRSCLLTKLRSFCRMLVCRL